MCHMYLYVLCVFGTHLTKGKKTLPCNIILSRKTIHLRNQFVIGNYSRESLAHKSTFKTNIVQNKCDEESYLQDEVT